MALKAKIEHKLQKVKKFHPKHVLSKLREEGWGHRRIVWLLLAALLYYQGWTLFDIVKVLIFLALFLFIALPFVFKYTPWIQRHLVFLPFVRVPGYINFTDPESVGLPGSRNFYLESEPGVKLGVWQILPADINDSTTDRSEKWFTEQLSDNRTVVLYLHGNSNNRAGPHRIELYHFLRKLNYHIITFDYRGYADSTQLAPNETAVVADAKAVYDWVKEKTGSSKLIVWGHSLGTAVSSHLVADLCLEGNRPDGLILESPFNNVFDEVRSHPMAWVWRKMPYFDWFFTSALEKNDLGFVSDQRISVIDIPILILHAKDDVVVPFMLGQALYEAAEQSRSTDWPKFVCLFALAGLAAGAPSPAAVRLSSASDQEAVISSIMLSLQPSIDAAISKALGETSFSLTSTKENVGPVQFSGSVGSTNYGGSYGAEQSSFTSSYETSSNNADNLQTVSQVSSQGQQGERHFQTAGLGGVVYHDGGSAQQQFNGAQQTVSTFTQEVSSNQASSSFAAQQQQVVQGVMTALVPSIEAAVQAALLNMQQQQSSVSSSSFSSTGSQQFSDVSSAQLSGVTTVTASVSAAEEQALVARIIEVLTPSITTSVRKALANRVQTVQVQTVQVPVAVSQQNFAANQQASFGSSSSSAFNSQAVASSSSTSSSKLVAQIIAALKPSIALSVQEALDAQSFSTQSNQAFNTQAVSSGFNSQSSTSSVESSGSLSAGSLSNIFGNGGVHNVKVETPEYKIEYNN